MKRWIPLLLLSVVGPIALLTSGKYAYLFILSFAVYVGLLDFLQRTSKTFIHTVLNPGIIIYLLVVIGVVFKFNILVSGHNETRDFLLGNLRLGSSSFNLYSSLVVVFLLFVLMGFKLGFRFKIKQSNAERESFRISRRVSVLILLLNLFLTYTFVQANGGVISMLGEGISRVRTDEFYEGNDVALSLGYLKMIVNSSGLLSILHYLSRKNILKGTNADIILCLSHLVCFLFIPFISSARSAIFAFFISFFIVAESLKVIKFNLRKVLVIGILFLTILTGMLYLRHASYDAEYKLDVAQEIAASTVGSRHFLDLTKTIRIISYSFDNGFYYYGESYTRVIKNIIPRSLFPNKPSLGLGPELGPIIFNTNGAGVPPGLIGESFLNFGILGIFVATLLSVLNGYFLKLLFVRAKTKLLYSLYYGYFLFPLTISFLTFGFSRTLTFIIINAIMIYVVTKLTLRRINC